MCMPVGRWVETGICVAEKGEEVEEVRAYLEGLYEPS